MMGMEYISKFKFEVSRSTSASLSSGFGLSWQMKVVMEICLELDYGVVDSVGGHMECLRDGICLELPDRGMLSESEKVVEKGVPLQVPLTHLTWKNTPWDFSNKCRLAFSLLKNSFTMAPVLTHWRPDLPIIVETDASNYALAAILSVQESNGDVHPIAFHSRTFSTTELNYDVHNKELLAIFDAFKVWQHYLEGSTFPIDVVTDHKNLKYFLTTKILSWCQARWSEFLSGFNMVIRFHLGHLGTKLVM